MCLFVWMVFCWLGGCWFYVWMNYLLWISIVNIGSRMLKVGRIYFVIYFKWIWYLCKWEEVWDYYFVVFCCCLVVLYIYIDYDYFCICIKNLNYIWLLLIFGIFVYDWRKLYCFYGNKNFFLLCCICIILVEI